MVNVTWIRWKRYLQEQQDDEEKHEGIPYAECDCPPFEEVYPWLASRSQ